MVVAKSHPDGEIGMVVLIARASFVAIDDAGICRGAGRGEYGRWYSCELSLWLVGAADEEMMADILEDGYGSIESGQGRFFFFFCFLWLLFFGE